jgi:hypothetical protein
MKQRGYFSSKLRFSNKRGFSFSPQSPSSLTARALACAVLCILSLSLFGCSDAEDALDSVLDPPDRQEISKDTTGVNNFFNQPQFGSIEAQANEIRSTLGLRFVRVLFSWNDQVQSGPNAAKNYSFYDDILDQVPQGSDVLIVLAHTPGWMADPANWNEGDPRRTWVEQWLTPTVRRYAGRRGIIGWEVWNEPDFTRFASDSALGLENADLYFQLLSRGASVIRREDPTRLVLNAATRSIQQAFPTTLDYNKRLAELGAPGLVDVWNVHYYGEQFLNVTQGGGVGEFLRSLNKTIWVTESGETGVNNQLAYAETAWPFLKEEVPSIERFYWYEFASTAPADSTYGLRTTDSAFPVSDLYVRLRDRP